ncbi:DEAD-domain-containing protein [Piedraia hortae CBS 480.64]|uniref:ATP-dependent rRNA helicase RRP3 n=1 Tax=Piedraia hortae CBS 480.64 TaxID=1314780 RepID=A0A6A7BU00_9PEZI|nr:DEAD-domain-containing protein [Piedraia hortae CBS 480.64]
MAQTKRKIDAAESKATKRVKVLSASGNGAQDKEEAKAVKQAKEVKEAQKGQREQKVQETDKGHKSHEEQKVQKTEETKEAIKNFADLGVTASLCDACDACGFKTPTPIQRQAIPLALEGKDIIGLAETGSGKTAAFALPMLQALLDHQEPFFGLVLSPTRELAFQIKQQTEALGSAINVRCAILVGGTDMMSEQIALAKKPHVVVATPGRLLDHLENTKGFSLRKLRFLVLDEADRLLDMSFGPAIEKILQQLPRERRTLLFSATMNKLDKLTRAALRSPTRVSVSASDHQTVKNLVQRYVFCPYDHKKVYFVALLNDFLGKACIVFARTVNETQLLAFLLRSLGRSAIPLHGQMSQSARLGALNKFRSGGREILVATDVAARGLDIPSVDLVVNFDIPQDSKTYIHRVGRTARAGRSGVAISFVTQYDVDVFQNIEKALGKKLEAHDMDKASVLSLSETVEEANRQAIKSMKEYHDSRKKDSKKIGISGGRAKKGASKGGQMDLDEG